MQELINKIEQWGYERDIHLASPLMQTTKTLEEVIELQQAIIKYDELNEKYQVNTKLEDNSRQLITSDSLKCFALLDIADAIGDIFVTLVMLSIQTKDINIETEHKILQEDVENLVQEDIENIFKQVFYMQRKLKTNEKFEVNVNNIVYFINYISYNFNLTLKECIEYAYNEIKDRKGKMVDGLWAKEQENE